MAEHTPGPLTISRARIPEFYTDEWYVNDSEDVESIAIVNGEANARLIAAAPDLLAALERVVSEDHWVGAYMPAGNDAIAKAKGE